MSEGPIVVAVNARVGTVGNGVEAVLLSVEIWPMRVVVHLAARQSELTDALQHARQSEFDAWVESGRQEHYPWDPAHVLVDDLTVALEDLWLDWLERERKFFEVDGTRSRGDLLVDGNPKQEHDADAVIVLLDS